MKTGPLTADSRIATRTPARARDAEPRLALSPRPDVGRRYLRASDIRLIQAGAGNRQTTNLLARSAERQSPDSGKPASATSAVLLVDDGVATSGPQQMTRSDFLALLQAAIRQVGMQEYEGSRFTVDGCPYISSWFAKYRDRRAADIEAAVLSYARGRSTETAERLIVQACQRAREGFREQVRSGTITQLPDDLSQTQANTQPLGVEAVQAVGARVIQRGCLRGDAAAPAPAPPQPILRKVKMKECVTVHDAHTTLQTDGFGGCIAVILIGPGNTRTLAHIYSGHVNYPGGWRELTQFRARAAAATQTHVYHWPSYWSVGDGDSDAFIAAFGLNPATIKVHPGAPESVQVDAALNVTQ